MEAMLNRSKEINIVYNLDSSITIDPQLSNILNEARGKLRPAKIDKRNSKKHKTHGWVTAGIIRSITKMIRYIKCWEKTDQNLQFPMI